MQFLKFLIVGMVGFIVDICVLYFLVYCEINLLSSRLFSFFLAVFATWILNSAYTFKDENYYYKFDVKNFINYLLCSAAGGIFNITIYYFILNFYNFENRIIIFAAAAGAVAGSFLNYFF